MTIHTRSFKSLFLGLVVALSSTALSAEGSVSFDIQLNPVGNFTAHAETLKGHATKKGAVYSAKGITFAINDLNSGVELRDDHMKEKYFETAKHPNAELLLASGKDGKFKAKLKIHGETKVVAGTYEVADSKLTAKFKTSLSAWKIPKAAYMGVGVVDDVEVTIVLPVK